MLNSCRCRAWTISSRRGRRPWPRLSRSRRRPMAMAPTILSFKVPCRTRGFCWRISFRDGRLFLERTQPRQPPPPIEPDRRLRHTLLCAGLVSIELEDANADPDHSGFCGARALRLQRQSVDQSLGTGEPLRGRSQLQSLQSLQLRAKQRRHRPLRAGSATAGRGGEAFVGRHRSVWIFLGPPHFAAETLFMRVGIPWISLDSLDRIETYQWVALDFPRQIFS